MTRKNDLISRLLSRLRSSDNKTDFIDRSTTLVSDGISVSKGVLSTVVPSVTSDISKLFTMFT